MEKNRNNPVNQRRPLGLVRPVLINAPPLAHPTTDEDRKKEKKKKKNVRGSFADSLNKNLRKNNQRSIPFRDY